jgi:hypothetical protein
MYLTQLDPAFLAVASGGTPSLDLFFSASGALGSLVTFTRASSGTFIDSTGALQTATTNTPRFTHNPSTLAPLGLLLEESRTNLLLNSATLSTQNVTVTAAAHTLSFTGTGTVTLSGVSTAGPLVGTGTGQANRVTLTFTPTAGTLTLTVSGSVTQAQLELGSFASSYIVTTGAAATRAADVCEITGSNFSSWYNPNHGTFVIDYQMIGLNSSTIAVLAVAGTSGNSLVLRAGTIISGRDVFAQVGGVTVVDSGTLAVVPKTSYRDIISFDATSLEFAITLGGTNVAVANAAMPTVNRVVLGGNANIARLRFYPRFMNAAQHTAFNV